MAINMRNVAILIPTGGVDAQADSTNPRWAETDRAIREHEGKIVSVVTHLISHMSGPRNMLCAGRLEGMGSSGYYLFIDSVKENLDGRRVVQGMLGHDCGNTSYEGNGEFVLYNFAAEQHPFREISALDTRDYEKALNLWDKRQR